MWWDWLSVHLEGMCTRMDYVVASTEVVSQHVCCAERYFYMLCSICSEGMSRDLSGEVEKLLKSSNPYTVRKVGTLYVSCVS